MTAVLLLKALVKFLQESVNEYAAAQAADGEFKAPLVFDWDLPFKDPRKPEKIDFPYICARIRKGVDPDADPMDSIFSTVEIDLYFGVYHPGSDKDGFIHADGGNDLLNLMEHIRQALLMKGIIENKYKIERPYQWEIPQDQPLLFWIGQASTVWSIQSINDQYGGAFLHG